MGDAFEVVEYEDGMPVETTRYDTREAAERRFAQAVARAESEPPDAAYRVELWADGILLGIYDTEDRP